MLTLPHILPAADPAPVGSDGSSTSDIDTGGYDVMVGGHGFRLATDQQNPFIRGSEPTTARRFDSSLEPGEQTLSELPWIKSQSSFHAGAGQLNLEQGFTAFQYQQEQVEHIRFDTCQGVDIWTPGQVSRLPDCSRYAFTFTPNAGAMVTATVGGVDYAVVGGVGGLAQVAFSSGPDSTPTITNIDLTSAVYGGAANCNIACLATDGVSYFGLVHLTSVGSTAGVKTIIISGAIGSTSAPTALYDVPTSANADTGVIGWAKSRLVGGLGAKVYELNSAASAHSALPATANYTHPNTSNTWTAISEGPAGVLISGLCGRQSTIYELTLTTAGAVPTLTGGTSVAQLPPGEIVYSMASYLSSFLAVGTTAGVRVGTFDTYTGALRMGPSTITSTAPVYGMTGRDRFIYAGFTNQQPDGKTGLAILDLSMVTDTAGRNAWAPSLRPKTTAPTGLGTVTNVGMLPLSERIIWLSTDGIFVEGGTPGTDGVCWVRTSRIRYDTAEMKLFKLGRVHGSLASAEIQVLGIAPYRETANLGTFGFLTGQDPGEFRLPSGLNEWIQLEFHLIGSTCVLNSYQVKALPAPQRQHIITLTLNCFQNEVDRFNLSVSDPETPRQRLKNLQDLESLGDETRFVEFTNTGAVAQLVVIDQMEFRQESRPSVDDDFGGWITIKLRSTEG